MMAIAWLAFSVVLGIVPLLAIAGLFVDGLLFTVDGLFMSLILLAISGIFLSNAVACVRRYSGGKAEKCGPSPLKAAQVAAGTEKGS
ncbi:MAG TPA: hypothetical protein VFK81_15770 [Terriglobales bacterium]|jgi:hypothetical protein|nr:hypothetical protein [Terriglobales bacterium]